MRNRDYIDRQEINAAARLAEAGFVLGYHYRVDADALRQHYNAALRDLIGMGLLACAAEQEVALFVERVCPPFSASRLWSLGS